MTTGQYTPLLDTPAYSEDTALRPQSIVNLESNFSQRSSITVHDLSRKQVTACCLLCSILNYICCPVLGIPALIFAILGLEAEKRQEIEEAKSHAFHLKVFNIIFIVKLIIGLVLFGACVLISIITPIAIRSSIHAAANAAANAANNGYNYHYNNYGNW